MRDQGTWRQQAYLKASNSDYLQSFGRSVALSGDMLAFGAPYEAGGARGATETKPTTASPASGAVYVYAP